MATAVKITLPFHPGKYAKNATRIVWTGRKCPSCGRGVKSFIAHPKRKPLDLGLVPKPGPLMMTVVTRWPRHWGPEGRSPGGPCGDFDATVTQVSDALAGPDGPFTDDAQVRIAILATVYDKANPGIEVTVAPLSRAIIELLEHETGLKLTEVLTVGQQVPL